MDLSPEALARARIFVREQGRPLERARLAFLFDDAPASGVLAELAAFRNADGGFGHGLEPDLRLPPSSNHATTVALQVMREAGAGPDEPLARGAVRWLLDHYDADARVWPIIPPEANDYPHAPWWTHAGEGQAEDWDGYLANPRAEIVGYLHDYAHLVPDELLSSLTEELVRLPEEQPGAVGSEGLKCYVRLLATRGLPEGVRTRLIDALRPVVREHVATDPDAWGDYVMRPLEAAPTPDAALADQLAEAVGPNLDYIVRTQKPDGSWELTWSWDDDYPDAWARAEREWRGLLVTRNLRRLAAWGRLPEV